MMKSFKPSHNFKDQFPQVSNKVTAQMYDSLYVNTDGREIQC